MLLVSLVCLCQLGIAQTYADVRVLIDVSGSMKQNDPQNLRKPAIRLLVNLLPVDSKAAMWMFARHALPLTEFRVVDSYWREQAILSANKIHSNGLYTNIPQALQVAMEQWQQEPVSDKTARSIILLTDGFVDIDEDQGINLLERRKVLQQIAPELKKLNVKVFSVALSKQADLELLQQLALITGGLTQQAFTAQELDKAFLKIFEAAVPHDATPIEENHFLIDASVKEFTLLVFKNEEKVKLQLINPQQEIINIKSDEKNIRWHQEKNYDLITVQQPLVGKWQIQGSQDPFNRVTLLTDLRLQSTNLPTQVFQDERFDFAVELFNKQTRIEDSNLLQLVNVTLQEFAKKTLAHHYNLALDQYTYRTQLILSKDYKKLELITQAKTKTFVREKRHNMQVHSFPLELSNIDYQAGQQIIEFKLTNNALVSDDTITLNVGVEDPLGKRTNYTLNKELGYPIWLLRLPNIDENLAYKIYVNVSGMTRFQRQFIVDLPVRYVFGAAGVANKQQPSALLMQQRFYNQVHPVILPVGKKQTSGDEPLINVETKPLLTNLAFINTWLKQQAELQLNTNLIAHLGLIENETRKIIFWNILWLLIIAYGIGYICFSCYISYQINALKRKLL
ncbi:MAG: hypothetical protein Tsb005_18430 [Gammaproteobacteria bacterium]